MLCRVLFLLVGISLYAQEIDLNVEKRKHSVREVLYGKAKLVPQEPSIVDKFKNMFEEAEVSGQLRGEYLRYDLQGSGVVEEATAFGGILKYELASLYGVNAGVAFYTSHDIESLSGRGVFRSAELSSDSGSYTQLQEAYLNYSYENFHIRLGRQLLDTPLVDSDDIRMIQNSFEAYMLKYQTKEIILLMGSVQSWQGYDAGLENSWKKIGTSGINLIGVQYRASFDCDVWYYNITGELDAYYVDGGFEEYLQKDLLLHIMAQYLKEEEIEQSGYSSDIYGGLFEIVFHGVGLKVAYNKADARENRRSFSGNGGGSLYTNMDTMILDSIAIDREASAVVGGISYTFNRLNILYAYGDFRGAKNQHNRRANIVEEDIALEYEIEKDLSLSALYVMSEDKENLIKTEYDFTRAQVTINYNF